MRHVLLVMATLLTGLPASAAENPSGRYGELLLSVQNNQVTAVFATSRGIGPYAPGTPMFSCAFLLQGDLHQGHADITSWTQGEKTVIKGELTLVPREARLRLESSQPGCAMAAGPMVQEDYVMRRDSPGPDWIGVGMVGSERATLQSAPGQHLRRTPYLVRYDAVAVLQRQPGWAKVRFYNGNKPVTGWLRETELVSYAAWPTRVDPP